MDGVTPKISADSSSSVGFLGRVRRAVTGLSLGGWGAREDSDAEDQEFLPIVDFSPAQAADAAARVTAAQSLPGFDDAKRLIVEAVAARADRLTLETAAASSIWHEIDGVRSSPLRAERGAGWRTTEPLSRDAGLAVARVLRTLSGLSDSGSPQAGVFEFMVDRVPSVGRLAVTRSTTGERLDVQFVTKQKFPASASEAGIPQSLADRLAMIVNQDKGLLILSSPPGHGLTTSTELLVESSDRFLRDFIAIAHRDHPLREIVNLTVTPYGHEGDLGPAELLKTAMHRNTGVIVAPDVRDKGFAVDLVDAAATRTMVLMSVKAHDAVDAIRRVMKCGVAPKLLAAGLRGSICQRLVRRLCPRCRVPANASSGPRTGSGPSGGQPAAGFGAAPQGCQLCRGIGYRGRAGIFEMAAGDSLRRTVAAGGDSDTLRQAALKDGMKPLAAAGLELVAEGVTSRAEIDRVLAVNTDVTPARGVRR